MPDADAYALTAASVKNVEAPALAYQPPAPKNYNPRLALIGAGGIAAAHLDAYRTAQFDVAVICSRTLARADARRDEFFPGAQATDDFDRVLADPSIEVLDITPHPSDRFGLIEKALAAGKHVLSQKPFVTDLSKGEDLVQLARDNDVRLAVNQNGRWSPHMAYMREAVRSGLIGELTSCHTAIHWDHSWIGGTPFEDIEDLILFDFGIHWFDFLASLVGTGAQSVFATKTRARGQSARPPLLSQALVSLESGQASLVFDGSTAFGPLNTTYLGGTIGSLSSTGPDLAEQQVTLTTRDGRATPHLSGSWFNDGFRGAMGELLCAIEEHREPGHNAAANLHSLALTFAALKSAQDGTAIDIGTVRTWPQAG